MTDFCPEGYVPTPRIVDSSLATIDGHAVALIAKNLGHADTRIVAKHHGHLASSYIVNAIRADAPKFGFTPNASVVPLRG